MFHLEISSRMSFVSGESDSAVIPPLCITETTGVRVSPSAVTFFIREVGGKKCFIN